MEKPKDNFETRIKFLPESQLSLGENIDLHLVKEVDLVVPKKPQLR